MAIFSGKIIEVFNSWVCPKPFCNEKAWKLDFPTILCKNFDFSNVFRTKNCRFPVSGKYDAIIIRHMLTNGRDFGINGKRGLIEKVQRRAARFVSNNYQKSEDTVTQLLHKLQWPSLEQRRTNARLVTMFKISKSLLSNDIDRYIFIGTTNRGIGAGDHLKRK